MRAIALAFTLLLSTGAFARDYRDRDGWRRDDNYRDGDYGYGNGRGVRADVVSRVLSDLDRSRSYRYVDSHDRKHYESARRELERFQSSWAGGRFDTGRLDKAIDNLKHLAQSDRVERGERNRFARDIEDLRDFRASGGYNNGGYRNGRYPGDAYPSGRRRY
jgi:hypothetical protein